MEERKISTLSKGFGQFSNWVAKHTGHPITFILAVIVIVFWAITGPIFNYSDTWQLVINTGTTIITFLMVFVIQQSQNKDTAAIHIKLNELIAANKHASNRVVDIENLTEQELDELKSFYHKMSVLVQQSKDLFSSHSIDEKSE